MIELTSTTKKIHLQFDDSEVVQLCSRCGTPNHVQAGYCVDCGGQLQTPSTKTVKASEIIICKKCGRYNAPNEINCSNRMCGAELRSTPSDGGSDATYVLVCPTCGHENPPSASICEKCNADLDLVEVRPKASCPAYIVNIRTHAKATMDCGACHTIGRENFLSEQLQSCSYVSGQHVKITWDGQHFILIDESRNGTYVQGKRLSPGSEFVVPDGTIIGLGDPSPNQPLAAFFKLESHAD